MPGLARIIIHGDPSVPAIDAGRLARFAASELGVEAGARGGPLGGLAAGAAGCIVGDLKTPPGAGAAAPPGAGAAVPPGAGAAVPPGPPIYDGYLLQQLASGLIADARLDTLHVVVTGMLAATYSGEDGRYHARAVICSSPAILSAAGIVEAPARALRHYVEAAAGLPESGTHLRHGDPRLGAAAEVYLLQAAFYAGTGEAFCADPGCGLYNAHRQEELLSQMNGPRLCPAHAGRLGPAGGPVQPS